MNSKHVSAKLGRLALVITIALAAAVVLSRCVSTPAGVLAASNSLEGVWTVTVSPSGQPPFTGVTDFHRDGSVTIMENDGRLGIGVWEKVSDSRYSFTAWEYWKEGDSYLQAKISGPVELSKGNDEYSGPFTLQVLVVGNPTPIVDGSGTATGIRMSVK
jgi:hypothetical protein